jgi:Gpi18-like mannosyltransferase
MNRLLRAFPEIFANFLAPYLVYEALDARYGLRWAAAALERL